jgi:hypothetical protein
LGLLGKGLAELAEPPNLTLISCALEVGGQYNFHAVIGNLDHSNDDIKSIYLHHEWRLLYGGIQGN